MLVKKNMPYKLRVKQVAEHLGYNRSKLSRKSDVEIKTIRRLWNDEDYKPSMLTLERIADALGVQVADLIEYVPDN
jgi:DNA-binding Xre family transcriptional regulator